MSVGKTSPQRAGAVQWESEPLRYLLRIILRFLRTVFADAPEDGYFFNENDPNASRIMITGDIPVNAETIGDRPHIVPFFSGVQWQGVSLDQLKSERFMHGSRVHSDLVSGNLTISVLARNGNEGLFIAWHVANFTWILRRLLMKAGFNDIGQRFFISAPTSPGQLVSNDLDGEIVSVNATTNFSFVWSVGVEQKGNHLLEQIETTLETVRVASGGQPELPVGMIGSATMTTSGEQIRRGATVRQTMFPDVIMTKKYEEPASDETETVVGTRTIKIGEE